MDRPILILELLPEAFEPCGDLFERDDGSFHDPASRLLAIVEIQGVLHHLELIEVVGQGSEQRAVIDELEASLDAAVEISGAAPFATVRYANRSYVCLLTPFEA